MKQKHPLDLAKRAKKAYVNHTFRPPNPSLSEPERRIQNILSEIWKFRNEGWSRSSELDFNCEHRDYDDLRLQPVSNVPEISAVFWMIQLMTDLLVDTQDRKSRSEFEQRYPLLNDALKSKASEFAQLDCELNYPRERALKDIIENSVEDNLLKRPSIYRIDRKSDSETKNSNRVFRWILACLKAKHPVLILYPMIKGTPEESMYESEKAFCMPSRKSSKLHVPAVAYEATTTVIRGPHLPVYQHGVRCRLFLPNRECDFRTAPEYLFDGRIKDCWLLTDTPWLDCIG